MYGLKPYASTGAREDRANEKPTAGGIPMKKVALLVSIGALLVAVAAGARGVLESQGSVGVVHESGSLEKLFGIRVGAHTIAFRVLSSGCTSADDFRVLVIASKSNRFSDDSEPAHLLLIRDRLDGCRAVDEIVSIRFPREDLGLEPNQFFVIENSFVIGP